VKLYFSRHGESEANVQHVFWNQPEGYGLTDVGRTQAEALADALAGVQFSALHCSPILRAAQTAQIVGRRLGLAPEVEDGLREWHTGILEGQGSGDKTEGLYRWVTEQWMVCDNRDARIEGGESYNDIVARFMPLIGRLEEAYCDTEANVLLVSHGGTLRAMLPLLVSNLDNTSILRYPFAYATPIVVELRDGDRVCLRWSEQVL
jgi:broad specificity phosphatase PhoE